MKNKVNGEVATNVFNIIGSGTKITGNIEANGDLRIDGNLEGNLQTAGKLIIGETGFIKGETKVKIADISGKYEGKLIASELVVLRAGSNFTGDLFTNKIIIEEGSVFNGTCTMKKETNDPPKQGQKTNK